MRTNSYSNFRIANIFRTLPWTFSEKTKKQNANNTVLSQFLIRCTAEIASTYSSTTTCTICIKSVLVPTVPRTDYIVGIGAVGIIFTVMARAITP
jgi:hypothetical protein